MPKHLLNVVSAVMCVACLNLSILPARVLAAGPRQTPDAAEPKPEATDEPTDVEVSEDESAEKAEEKPRVEYGATELGIRMTPGIAQAISESMTRRMKGRYELDDEQTKKATEAISYNILKLAHENSEIGRDAIEFMMATMIANDGEMPKENAIEFAKKMKPIIPALRQFFLESSRDVGKVMSLKQRLQFTGDMTGVTAGLTIFETRMNRWEAGEVSDGANPFFDRPVTPDDEEVEGETKAQRDARRARRDVERSMNWMLNHESNWEQYVRNAVLFYDFDEEQQNAANGILEDCKARVTKVKTDEWMKAYVDNRVADRLSWRLDSKFNQGPMRFQLEKAHDKLMKPIQDIEKDLKRRIDTLPTTKQRLEAKKAAEQAMQEHGIDKLPL
ncbi:MAG: hypothetical protein KDA33_01715 [Phycisphaerales bacterium]|nr:hypothetical protein [Phycisphaerales bacterium]